jgi:ATP-dependent Clp protease ATP-binding subunit ClpC
MYERFTDRARKTMQLANQEAQRFNHEYIGTEHILLGLIKEGSGVAANVFRNLDIDLRKIRSEVEKIVQSGPHMVSMGKLPQTPRAKKVIEYAIEEARAFSHNYVGTEHLLLGLLREQEGVAAQVLMNLGANLELVRSETLSLLGRFERPTSPDVSSPSTAGEKMTPSLDSFGRDLNEAARAGNLDPVVGREKEMERLLVVLGCRTAGNPLLVGPSGVGKTALVAGLAQQTVRRGGPVFLRDRRFIALNLTWMRVLTGDRAKFHCAIRSVFNEVRAARNQIVLFLEDLHALVGPRAPRGWRYVGGVLESALARGHLRCIGAATEEEYDASLARDTLLGRHFQPIRVQPPTKAETLRMLQELRTRYALHHGVAIEDSAVRAAVELADVHLTSPCFPEKAVRVLDQACALVSLQSTPRPPDLPQIDAELEHLQQGKEDAVANHDFTRAAALRDQADQLKTQRETLNREWERQCRDSAGVVTADAVAQIIRQMADPPC